MILAVSSSGWRELRSVIPGRVFERPAAASSDRSSILGPAVGPG